MFCGCCGAKQDDAARFCVACGSSVKPNVFQKQKDVETVSSNQNDSRNSKSDIQPRVTKKIVNIGRVVLRLASVAVVIGIVYNYITLHSDQVFGLFSQIQIEVASIIKPNNGAAAELNPAVEPTSAQIIIDNSSELTTDLLDPDFQRKMSLNDPKGQTILARSILIDSHDDSEYTSGGNGFVIGYTLLLTPPYLIECQLTLDDTKRYIADTDSSKGKQIIFSADLWGTVQSYSQDSGFVISPCEYKIVAGN